MVTVPHITNSGRTVSSLLLAGVQVVNQEMLDFGRNWVAHLRRAGASNFLVGVYEQTTAAALAAAGVPCLDMAGLIQLDPNGAPPCSAALSRCSRALRHGPVALPSCAASLSGLAMSGRRCLTAVRPASGEA